MARLRRLKSRLMDHLVRIFDWVTRRRGRVSGIARRCLSAMIGSFGGHRVVTLGWLDDLPATDALSTQILRPEMRAASHGPSIGGNQPVVAVQTPAVRAYRFRRAGVNAASSSVLLGENLVVEAVDGVDRSRCSFVAGHVVAHAGSHAIVRTKGSIAIDDGIFLGGNGSFNYYHWMLELLPKVEFVAEVHGISPTTPLLVSEDVTKLPTFREGLDLVRAQRPVVVMPGDATCVVENLVYITSPSRCPFNLRRHERLEVQDFAFRPESIEFIRDRLGADGAGNAPPTRVFLARRANRRQYNQGEILKICTQRGFSPVFLEDLSLAHQARTIASAEAIVGPSGAAWTNLIFARPGARCLSWLPEEARAFAAYSNIARVVGADLRFMTYRTGATSTAELYLRDYVLDVATFSRELNALLGD